MLVGCGFGFGFGCLLSSAVSESVSWSYALRVPPKRPTDVSCSWQWSLSFLLLNFLCSSSRVGLCSIIHVDTQSEL
jgi:hypothetical protein